MQRLGRRVAAGVDGSLSPTERVGILVVLGLSIELLVSSGMVISAGKVVRGVVIDTRPGVLHIQKIVICHEAVAISHGTIMWIDLAILIASGMVILLPTRPTVAMTPLSHHTPLPYRAAAKGSRDL